MQIGDKVVVIVSDGDCMEEWVKVGMIGVIDWVYPKGHYRYRVRFDNGKTEDFSSEEIGVVKA